MTTNPRKSTLPPGGSSQPNVHVEAVQADLRLDDEVERLYRAITATGRPVAAAAVNAGVGQGGASIDTDLADELAVIDLNVTSTLQIAKRLLRDMVARDEGRILITSSIASTMPGSFQAVYNASKSFLQSFAEALQNELKDTNVTITSLMPGPTDTDFFRRATCWTPRSVSSPRTIRRRWPSRASRRSWRVSAR